LLLNCLCDHHHVTLLTLSSNQPSTNQSFFRFGANSSYLILFHHCPNNSKKSFK